MLQRILLFRMIKVVLAVVLAVLIAVVGYLAYVLLTYNRTPDNQPLKVTGGVGSNQVYKNKKALYFCCKNSLMKIPTEKDLIHLMTSFKSAGAIKGTDGFWSTSVANMEDVPSETLAYVDDTNKLIILNETVFEGFFKKEISYISATEYAELHGECRDSVKNMCTAVRKKGAVKHSTGWMIPENAPYPERKNAKK